MLTFQRLIARRYFALGKPRSWRAFLPSIVALVLLILISIASAVVQHAHSPAMQEFRANYGTAFLIGRLVLQVINVLFWVATLMAFRLNIFTAISIYGLFLGAGAMVMVLSIMSGFEHDLKRKILGTNAHVVITRPDSPFTDYARLRDQFARLPGVVGATPYVMNEVMISSQSNLSGVVVKGIDPATVGQVTDLVRNTDTGGLEYLSEPAKLRGVGGPPIFHDEPEDPKRAPKDDGAPADAVKFDRRVVPGVIIGRELHKNLRVYLGDDVNIVSPFGGIGPSGAIPKSKPFRVAGIFFSGMFEYDTKYVYITLAEAQKFFNMPGEVTGVELKAGDPERTEPIRAAVEKLAGAGYEVQDWKQLNRSLFSALKIEKILMFVLLCFIILVAAFSIIANGTMLVMEKGREVAILKSMGASDGAVLGAFMMLGLYIGALGTLSGIAIGIAGCWVLGHYPLPLNSDVYYITALPVKMNPYEIVTVLFAALAIALLATLYPAWMAARLRPVEGLRDAQR